MVTYSVSQNMDENGTRGLVLLNYRICEEGEVIKKATFAEADPSTAHQKSVGSFSASFFSFPDFSAALKQ